MCANYSDGYVQLFMADDQWKCYMWEFEMELVIFNFPF